MRCPFRLRYWRDPKNHLTLALGKRENISLIVTNRLRLGVTESTGKLSLLKGEWQNKERTRFIINQSITQSLSALSSRLGLPNLSTVMPPQTAYLRRFIVIVLTDFQSTSSQFSKPRHTVNHSSFNVHVVTHWSVMVLKADDKLTASWALLPQCKVNSGFK